MGNRATIEVRDHASSAPACVYLHWHGSPEDVIEAVKGAAPRMRATDASYALGRLFGHYHNLIEGGLSLAVISKDESDYYLTDNGHYVVDMAKGTIEQGGVALAEGLEFGQF